MKTVLFVIGLMLATPCIAATPQASPATPSLARQALEISITRILNCIKNPDYVNPKVRQSLRQQIEDEVLHRFDFNEFSSRTVGPRWRTFTPEQKSDFSRTFSDLLINTYVNKIDGYNGEEVTYIGETNSPSGDRTEIRTEITMKDGKKVSVSYRMLPKGTDWHVYDVLVENISLVKNYRTQFQDILNTATPDQLIERVKSKVREVQK